MQKSIFILMLALPTVTQCADQKHAAAATAVAIATSAAMLRADIHSSTHPSSTSPVLSRPTSPKAAAAAAAATATATRPSAAIPGTGSLSTASTLLTTAMSAKAQQAKAAKKVNHFYQIRCHNCSKNYKHQEYRAPSYAKCNFHCPRPECHGKTSNYTILGKCVIPS